jgi:hypothetical protein
MKCPRCGGTRVFHSRAKSFRDRLLKRALPITFYRCHECNWRRPRFVKGWKGLGAYSLALVGYGATIALVIAIALGLLFLVLNFLGIPMPWSR